jgi:putative SOS response-associated peptidase YedK
MCGRYDNLIAREAYRLLFNAERLPQSNFPPRYNIAPTDQIPIIRVDPRDGERELAMARWGLVPWFAKTMPKVSPTSMRVPRRCTKRHSSVKLFRSGVL